MHTTLEGIHPVSLNGVKAFLLTCGNTLVLVDTGGSEEDADTILRYIKSLNKSPKDVEMCLITHRHRDHIGGLYKLKKGCGFRVASHEGDASAIKEITGILVDVILEDGQTLQYCGGIRVIHIPGHTSGNICLFIESKRAIIVGDTLFVFNGKLSPPPERYCEDYEMAKRGLRRLLELDFDTMLVSHGEDLWSGAKAELAGLLRKLE